MADNCSSDGICGENMRQAVGIVLINKDNLVFFGRRVGRGSRKNNIKYSCIWQMPQGGIEIGENPTDAVYRELMEEAGTNNVEQIAESSGWFEYIIPNDMRRKNSRFVGQRQKWFLFRFMGRDEEFNLDYVGTREFGTWKWADANTVIKRSIYFKRKLYIDVFNEFSRYVDFGIENRSENIKNLD